MLENLRILFHQGQHACVQTLTPSLRPPHQTRGDGHHTHRKKIISSLKQKESSSSNIITTYFSAPSSFLHFFVCLIKAQLYYCQSSLDKTVALRNSSRASASSITQYCVCFSSGATDFLIYLLLPLPSQTDHLSPVALGSPRRKRTPDSFLSVLNAPISVLIPNRCQHLHQSQRFSSF